jgi:hypothetical protein
MVYYPRRVTPAPRRFLSVDAFVPRILKTLIALCFLLAPSTVTIASQMHGEPSGHEQPISVNIHLPKKEFRVGEHIEVKVEVSNVGRTPLLVANGASIASGGASYIEFELTDSKGQISPQTRLISDSFSANEKSNPTMSFLTRWVLLSPGASISTKIVLDGTIIDFLAHPGTYDLGAHYSSNGLSYSPTYAALGITADDVKLITIPAWKGKIASNHLVFTILPKK